MENLSMGSSSEKMLTSQPILSIAPIHLTSFDRMSGSFLFSRGYRTRLMGARHFWAPETRMERRRVWRGDRAYFNYYPRQACSEAKYSVDPAREEYLRNLCVRWHRLSVHSGTNCSQRTLGGRG